MMWLFLAEGFETVEALATVDFLRRAGVEVVTYGVEKRGVKSSQNVIVEADQIFDKFTPGDDLEGIILPGGLKGTKKLEESELVNEAIDYCLDNNRIIAAICAAPTILGKRGVLKGKKAVCYPGMENELIGADVQDCEAVRDGNFITGKAAGASWLFAAEIVAALKGREVADKGLDAIKWNR